jgi:hypothetical protein
MDVAQDKTLVTVVKDFAEGKTKDNKQDKEKDDDDGLGAVLATNADVSSSSPFFLLSFLFLYVLSSRYHPYTPVYPFRPRILLPFFTSFLSSRIFRIK